MFLWLGTWRQFYLTLIAAFFCTFVEDCFTPWLIHDGEIIFIIFKEFIFRSLFLFYFFLILFFLFCTFSEQERLEADVKNKTVSLWSLVVSHILDYQNPLYNPATANDVLLPLTSIRHVRLWDTYYCRWNPAMRNQVRLAWVDHSCSFS